MPKINVYLPDDLAESVKDTGLPVSAICQRALEQSVKRVTAIRAVGDLTGTDPTAALTSFTQRAKDVLNLAITAARARGAAEVGTRDLLRGMIEEGSNLALRVLRAIDIDPAKVLGELPPPSPSSSEGAAARFGVTAANALELTVLEALTLGHNYVGCEHLLLGLVAEPDGTAGQVLRGLGAEARQVRQVVSAALAGYVHLQANQGGAAALTTAVGKALEPVLRRLDRLEEQAGLT
ncbi:MAG: Clp protease N-terminal domain-containing protein [Actinophytocola sp.]|uniref:Clp protease N-terminal domain-containing protein n=1 Tax=Actinophytocola sp. TaxID=1872138 RepID=UPI003C73250B